MVNLIANLMCSVDASLGYFKTEGKGISCGAGLSEHSHSLSGMGHASPIQYATALEVPKQFQDTECPKTSHLCCYSLILRAITKGLKKKVI